LAVIVPPDKAAKFSMPTSIPTEVSDAGRRIVAHSKVRVASQPLTERFTVQVLMTALFGISLLTRTLTLPILANDNRFPSKLNPVSLNENESYLSLLLNRGKPGATPNLQRRKKFSNERFNLLMTF
jgi:hypothetical protein